MEIYKTTSYIYMLQMGKIKNKKSKSKSKKTLFKVGTVKQIKH